MANCKFIAVRHCSLYWYHAIYKIFNAICAHASASARAL